MNQSPFSHILDIDKLLIFETSKFNSHFPKSIRALIDVPSMLENCKTSNRHIKNFKQEKGSHN